VESAAFHALPPVFAATPGAAAAGIRVISGGGAKSFVRPLADSFASLSGQPVQLALSARACQRPASRD